MSQKVELSEQERKEIQEALAKHPTYTPLDGNELLLTHISTWVPFHIRELEKQGGITLWHIEEAQRRMRQFMLNEVACPVQYQSKVRNESRDILTECLAVMAFMPGGVKFSGLRFEGKPTYTGKD